MVVEFGFEFSAPAGEGEVEQDGGAVFKDGNGAKVACPRVVGFCFDNQNPVEMAQLFADSVRLRRGDN